VLQFSGSTIDQGGGDAQFHAIELVVDGLVGDGDAADALAVGGQDGGLLWQDDSGHQLDQLREEQLPGVLLLGRGTEQLVQTLGGEQALQAGTGHDTEGGVLYEGLEGGRQHPWLLG
jgi:hypothetical protein